jgi:type I restriction enzyme M protein
MSGTTVQSQRELFPRDPVDEPGDESTVDDGYVLDFITGEKKFRDTPKEQVRQRIARAIFHEYGISVEDMEPDFSVRTKNSARNMRSLVLANDCTS